MKICEMFELLQQKVEKDYREICHEYMEKEKKDIINNAYAIAHYNEITDYLDDIVFNQEEYENKNGWRPLDIDEIMEIIKYDGNFVKRVFSVWLDYNHPERFNFFCWEDLNDIIKETLKVERNK